MPPDRTAILILGAAVWPDGPSPALRRRTNHAAMLYHAGLGHVLVPCGGIGQHPPSEAQAMALLLHEAGVPPDVVHMEDRSTNTAQNIGLAVPILERLEARHVILVSDAYHLPRAQLLARRAGLNATSSAPSSVGADEVPWFKGWAIRESIAYLATLIRLKR